MHIMLSVVLVLATSLTGVSALPGPLRLANTFSHITNELSHISLGNCSLANASLPLSNLKVGLPEPSLHLTLKYIAVGRGTQNYSCPSTDASSRDKTAPTATGAAATLFDASCIASSSMTLLHELPAVAGRTPLGSLAFMAEMVSSTTNSSDLIIGEHYFDAAGDPFFNLRLGGGDDWMVGKKDASVSAPAKVYAFKIESKDVTWLRLTRKEGKGIKEVYRVMTFEGGAPSTCAGLNDTVIVEYAAEYWFYG
ncbi:hypothetical protein N7448_001147 [Penicillium atrosanguineum]|uniref:Frag1/DRAM/Sfk1 n=1 Tax=Penicillium atrosanguineum TaxID=1132637 RepID=UPI002385AE69|nr:Frag1/DRAM/Sfk1 [Penicillium atrosanguineum]KAJ5133833.1 hypothetical protein N7526_005198 [Penicillium atrosanguineum]KAJ5149569.1 hypothetical protein N7448_001147 [Penicillium atrosanguineum]KAJ5304885.1 Frag1/DRAM/Sfk1 [Penicillium atrosanguineum]